MPQTAPTAYKRILLTGGTGFVGRHLAPALAAAFPDAERLILAREAAAIAGWRAAPASLTDAEAVRAVCARFQPDLILHLAAQASIGAAHGAREATWRVNFNGAQNLAEACAETAAPQAVFLFASSGDAYGASFLRGPATEETPLQPLNAYSRSKMATEAMLQDALGPEQRLIVARPFNHTGPGQDMRFVLPSFAAQIAAIEAGARAPRLEVGNLEAERDFLDVRDVCDAYLALARRAAALPLRSIFNIASERPRKIRALLDLMQAQARRPFEIAVDPARMRPSDIPVSVGSARKLREETAWSPAHAIEQTLEDLLNYWRAAELRMN